MSYVEGQGDHRVVIFFLQIVVLKLSILHPKFREIGQLVPEPEKFLRGFPKYGHGGHFWSCDLDFLNTHWFPLPIDASHIIWV